MLILYKKEWLNYAAQRRKMFKFGPMNTECVYN